MKQRPLKILEISVFVILAGSFLFFVPLGKVINAVRAANPFFFWLSCLLNLPVVYLSVIRWHLLVQKQGIFTSRLKLFELSLVVRFYSFFSAASMLGSLLRWQKLSGDGKSAEALTAITVNRLLDVFIAVVFGLFWAVSSRDNSRFIQPAAFVLFVFLLLLLWLFFTRYAPFILGWSVKRMGNRPGIWARTANFFARLSSSLQVYSKFSSLDLLLLIGVGMIGELISLLGLVCLARALQIPVSFNDLGWMKSIFFLAALTPFTLTGGFGLREISVVLVLAAFGVNADLAAAFSFLMYVRSVILSLMGGMLELFSFLNVPFHEHT